jgi:hypothetical protein
VSGQVKKENITMNDLPDADREAFRTRFIPLLREYTGTLASWEQPDEMDIRNLWSLAFSYQLDDDFIGAVSKLVSSCKFNFILLLTIQSEDRLSEWRNKFATVAMICVDKYFAEADFTPEERVLHVQWLLGESDKSSPFYYKFCEEGGKPVVRLIFQYKQIGIHWFLGNIPIRNCINYPGNSYLFHFRDSPWLSIEDETCWRPRLLSPSCESLQHLNFLG